MNDNRYPSVAVLMSTYNGEMYIREQIDSILSQKEVDIYLFIRDDSSTDSTVEIIEEYITKYQDRISFYRGNNIGAGCSFMDLVYTVPDTYDYYAFSDQDDIWLDDKICSAVKMLKESGKELYMGNLICVDQDLNNIGFRNTNPPDISPYGIMVNNETNGCTMVFTNNFLRMFADKSKRPNADMFKARYHDSWAAIVGAVNEIIIYDFDAHILYRQHSGNAVGATNYNNHFKRIRLKINKLKDKSKRNGRSRIAREIVKAYPEESKKYEYLYTYADAQKLSCRLSLIKNYKEYKKHGNQSFLEYVLYIALGLI